MTALDGVTVGFPTGKITAVVGENGAGKSTLMNILAGLQRPDKGLVRVFGEKVENFDPHALLTIHRVALVPQELLLCPERTVAENVLLGLEPSRGPIPSRRQMRQRTAGLLEDLGSNIGPGRVVADLSVAEQQEVVIARALARECRVLILDEPTAVLSPEESERLFALLRRLRNSGTTIVYVSHRIPEVFSLADKICVMRDGRLVKEWPTEEAAPGTVVRFMIGRELSEWDHEPAVGPEPLCSVRGFGGPTFRDVSFELMEGEVLGVAGLPDSGRNELLGSLFGAITPYGGTVQLSGRLLWISSPRDAIRAGMAYVPAERRTQGLLPTMDIADNLAVLRLKRFTRLGFVRWRALRREAARQAERFGVRCRGVGQGVGELSGGNQQKVILARWMEVKPRLMLLEEPTRGVDVGAKDEIYELLQQMTQEGVGVILASSDLPELLRVCDRIAVMRLGRLVGFLDREHATEEKIMALATGVEEGAA
ncbi:sugar ABC transporter ATP-binding protein [Rubrobacter xylanophilus]|uniref:sugar ABC transporter ATP-binding protein n=1 Tax=Rubrobacter xylanophilus TaxID=49319 RepID=UPI0018DD8380|nr:sugar ABC transporter ATP-binding protein [Rubrobacter xylanophilus]